MEFYRLTDLFRECLDGFPKLFVFRIRDKCDLRIITFLGFEIRNKIKRDVRRGISIMKRYIFCSVSRNPADPR